MQANQYNKNWLSHKNRKHVNTEIFKIRKKHEFSGQRSQYPKKNEFLKLTHMSSPGQLQAAPRADTRYYTEQRLIFAEKRL